jgi:Tol biopolymer transport system component
MKTFLTAILCSFIGLGNLANIQAQNSEKLFSQGMMKEEGTGNLKEAIDTYNKIVNNVSADRTLRAKALLQVGICYEKLGNQKARKSYQKLIAEFADQSEIVAIGKEKLKGLKEVSLTKKNRGIIATQIKSPEGEGGRISPDGQSLIYVDWTSKGDKPAIKIKDLRTGKKRIVSKVGIWEDPIKFPDSPTWSPDGKQFAYYWYDKVEGKDEFHIANADGTSDKIIERGNHVNVLYPIAWSPDGKYILCLNEGAEGMGQAVLFSVKDRSSKILKQSKKNGSGANFSPDSKYIVYAMQQTENSEENDIYLMSLDGSIDKKIISNTADDFNPIWSPNGKHILFMSDRHGTNDLWKIGIENGLTVGTAVIVKANMGNILGITKDQTLYYETDSRRWDVYLLHMDLTGKTTINATTRITDLKMDRNLNPAISKDGRYVAFVSFQSTKGPAIIGHPFFMGKPVCISIYDTKTGTLKNTTSKIYKLANLYIYSPKLQWSPNGDKILLQGRIIDNGNVLGGVFSYDVKTEEFETILEVKDYKGFSETPSTGTGHTFSNDGKNMYYLNTDRNNILKIEIGSKKESVLYTSAKSLDYFKISKDASKIAYIYEDDLGEIYVEPLNDGKPNKIVSFNGDDQNVQLIGWDSDDNYIYYAKRQSWVPNAIMRISAEGGSSEHITNLKDTFPEGRILDIIIDSENRAMAIDHRIKNVEMWKLEGVFND